MHWIGKLLLLLLLHSFAESKGKRRKRETKDAVDPLLSLVFNTPQNKHDSKIKEKRPDRAISPDEELAALLDAVGKKNTNQVHSNVQEKRSAIYPQTQQGAFASELTGADASTRSTIPSQAELTTRTQNVNIPTYSDSMNSFTRSAMPKPEMSGPLALNPNPSDMENAGLITRTMPVPKAQPVPFQPLNVASSVDVPSQQTVPGIVSAPAVSFSPVPGSQGLVNNTLAKKSEVAVPGSIPSNEQQGITFFLPDNKKSSIPIPVQTQSSEVVRNRDSEPIQLRKMSPNMNLRGIVPHNPEYGETVESVTKADDLLRRSGIPRPIILPKIIYPARRSSISRLEDETKTRLETSKRTTIPSMTQPLTPFSIPSGQPISNYEQSPPLQGYASPATFSTGGKPGVNPFTNPEYLKQFQLEQSGMHAKPKDVAADECADQFPGQCVEFVNNNYCKKFEDLMRVQCRKSCHFCTSENESSDESADTRTESGSGSDGSSSGSGDESSEGLESRDEANKSKKKQILFLPELGSGSGGSGSGTGEAHAQHQLGKGHVRSSTKHSQKKTIVPTSAEVNAAMETKVSSQVSDNPAAESASKKSEDVSMNQIKKSTVPQVAIASEYSKGMPIEAAGSDNESGSGSGSGDESGSGDDSGSGESETESAKEVSSEEAKASVTAASKKKTANVTKKATIPKPQEILKRLSHYPKIDLKVIASALARYEEAALQMAAEYPHYMKENMADVERSSIPKPEIVGNVKVEKMKQDIQVAKLSMQDHSRRFEIPKYLIVGEDIHEKGGVDKEQSSLEDAASLESVTARFKETGRAPSLMDYYAETGKTSFEETGARRSRLSRRKKLKPVDPYEYLRNMAPGASMEPIIDPKARSSVPSSHSYPLFLMKVAPGSDKYIEAPASRRTYAPPKPVIHNPMQELQQHFVAPPPAHVAPPQPVQPISAAEFFAPQVTPVKANPFEVAPPPAQAAPPATSAQNQFMQVPGASAAKVVSQTGVTRGQPGQLPNAQLYQEMPFAKNVPAMQTAEQSVPRQNANLMAAAAAQPGRLQGVEKQIQGVQIPAAAASLQHQNGGPLRTVEGASPLRSKMLSAFFNNKHAEESEVETVGSGSGAGGREGGVH